MDKKVLDPDKVLVIHDFLSREECAALIRRSEDLAYEAGTVADVVIEQVRNNERVLVDDVSLAADLFHRAAPLLPGVIEGHGLVGFNERWRFYRYRPGQTFKPHRDGSPCWRFTAVLGFGESLDELRGDGSRRRWQNLTQHRLLRRAWLAVG